MAMSNAERQARYRARKKAEPNETSVTDGTITTTSVTEERNGAVTEERNGAITDCQPTDPTLRSTSRLPHPNKDLRGHELVYPAGSFIDFCASWKVAEPHFRGILRNELPKRLETPRGHLATLRARWLRRVPERIPDGRSAHSARYAGSDRGAKTFLVTRPDPTR